MENFIGEIKKETEKNIAEAIIFEVSIKDLIFFEK